MVYETFAAPTKSLLAVFDGHGLAGHKVRQAGGTTSLAVSCGTVVRQSVGRSAQWLLV